MNGRALCEAFYAECVNPILEKNCPGLVYSAGLLGFGSDVLSYDDAVSRDHDWGPRLTIFPADAQMSRQALIESALRKNLPSTFRGFPVAFGEGAGPRSLINIRPFSAFLMDEIGRPHADEIAPAEWLAFSEHKLLSLTRGRFFRDELNLARELRKLAFYPRDVWLYLLYADWSAIAEERAFVKRTADRGDDLGARIIAGRIAHRLMHLAFLYERRFAPYSKWFGTAFRELAAYPTLAPILSRALRAHDPEERAHSIAQAQAIMIEAHNASGLTPAIDSSIHPYFTRDIEVAASDAVAEAIRVRIEDLALRALPPIGALSSVGNLTGLCENAAHMPRLMKLYE